MNGRVTYNAVRREWEIEAQPHVAMRLKRVFGKVSRASHGTLYLSDTDENARELEWFLGRYPMEVLHPDRLRERSAAHKERTSIVEAMLARRVEPPTFDLAIPPREYQRLAAGIVLAQGGLLLADEMGLGKSCTGICLLAAPGSLPAVVVTLTPLPTQWEREVNRFAPKLRTHILKGTKPYDLTRIGVRKRARGAQLELASALPDVIITSYSKLAAWAETLAPLIEGHTLILDEAQELRNMGGGGRPRPAKYAAAKYLAEHAARRLLLTGTPIHNLGAEFYAVLDIARHGVLGTRAEFVREWCGGEEGGGRESIRNPVAFGTYLRQQGLMLRRTRTEVGRELPPLSKVLHHVEADTAALDKVSAACSELAKTILRHGEAQKAEKLHASEELSNRLRQATGIAKAVFVADFVRMLVDAGESVVLYAWHREVYEIVLDRLKDLHPAMYTGSESTKQKEKAKTDFVNGKTKVLIMSLRSGAGLDGLQGHCRTVVFGELDWAYAVHEQAIARVHRDGQDEPVVAYFLVADHGADPVILDVLGLKKAQLHGVRDAGVDLVDSLETDGGRIKKLAAAYLTQQGIEVPKDEGAAA